MEPLEPTVVDSFRPSEAAAVGSLVDRVRALRPDAALSEAKVRALASGSLAAGMLVEDGTGRLVGYAQLDPGPRPDAPDVVELVVDPEAADTAGVADALLAAAVERARHRGRPALRLWVGDAHESDDERAAVHGLVVERSLLQLRCPLPPPAGGPSPLPPDARIRPFVVGADEEAWLTVNNRAFASHPEQGGWDRATLMSRQSEPWFDPAGLLLVELGGRVVASCWTKVHADTVPPMGEIYVVGVDPEFQRRGWGGALTRAGLESLADRGLTTGMLFVDAANPTALAMYGHLGFVSHHTDRAYLADLRPSDLRPSDPDGDGDGDGPVPTVSQPEPTSRPMP